MTYTGVLSEASLQWSIFQDLLEFLYCHSSIFRCFFNRHAALSHQLNQHPHDDDLVVARLGDIEVAAVAGTRRDAAADRGTAAVSR